MKNIFITIPLFMFMLALSLTGCKKDNPAPHSSGGANFSNMSATVDGVSWESLNNKTKTTISDSTVLIGIANDSTVIKIIIYDQIITDSTYNLASWTNHKAEFIVNSQIWSTKNHSSCTGTFEVTYVSTLSKKISGKFNFNAYNTADSSFKEIITGIFTSVPIQIINPPPPVPCEFYFKINNVAFNSSVLATDFTIPGDLIISASDLNGKGLTIVMPSSISTGTHSFGAPGSGKPYGFFYYNFTNSAESVSGTLQITKKNFVTDELAGTFSFTAKDPTNGKTFQITDGCFNFD